MERRKEAVNELIMQACDSEFVADNAIVAGQLTDSASSAKLLAGNCAGIQGDYALVVNGQMLDFKSSGGGGKSGGHRRSGGGGYPGGGGGGYPGGGGGYSPAAVCRKICPPHPHPAMRINKA